MKSSKKGNYFIILKSLETLALLVAFISANSTCLFCYHNPEKPRALDRLKKI